MKTLINKIQEVNNNLNDIMFVILCKDGFVIKKGSQNDISKGVYVLFKPNEITTVDEAREWTFVSPNDPELKIQIENKKENNNKEGKE